MNTDVMILREVVTKVTQLLAGMGLQVTQRGTKAAVYTNKRTHKPERVNIPFIPDNATRELILAIQGFIDHEVAHILETDFSVHSKIDKQKGRPALRNIWNTLEDTFIERRMAKRFSGSGFNLGKLHEFFITDITTPVLEQAIASEDWQMAFSVLFVPAFRAWSGQRAFQEFMAKGDWLNHPKLAAMFKRLEPFVAQVPSLKSTEECYQLAIKIDDALKAPPSPPPPPPPPPAPSPPEEEPENEPQNANGGEGETPEDEGKGPADEPQDDQPSDDEQNDAGKPQDGESDDDSDSKGEEQDSDADADGDEAGGEKASEDDDEGEGADADGSDDEGADEGESAGEQGDGAPDDEPSEDEGSGSEGADDAAGSSDDAGEDQEGSDEGEDGEAGSAGAGGDDEEPGEEASEGDEPNDDDAAGGSGDQDAEEDAQQDQSDGGDDAGSPENGSGVAPGEDEESAEAQVGEEDDRGEGNEDPTSGGPVMIVAASLDFEALAAARIGEEAKDLTAASPYRIYTKDFDVIEPFPTDMNAYQNDWLVSLDERTRKSAGVMQRDIERMMQARSQSVNVPGFRSGRLHTSGLHRLAAGDDRVFRRKVVNNSKDVAVELLIDNSGSMDGIKLHTAMEAGYALSTTLERVGIQHEVMGFTTKWHPQLAANQEARREARAAGIEYTRYEPIYMPVFKSFEERLTSEVKRRFAAAPYQDFTGSNIDGESVEYAARRLMLRKEARKVLIVLSDGNPICDGDIRALRAHLKDTITAIDKRGVETIGIGIMTDAPRHYYPKFALLQNAEELPKMVMGQLKSILLG